MIKTLVTATILFFSSFGWADQNAELSAKASLLHERILTIDAHADIEIPGQPSAYVGPDGLSKVAPDKMLSLIHI